MVAIGGKAAIGCLLIWFVKIKCVTKSPINEKSAVITAVAIDTDTKEQTIINGKPISPEPKIINWPPI